MEKDTMSPKKWKKEMGLKFLSWRQRNHYGGIISVPEVAHFVMELMIEMKSMLEKK